MINAVILAGGKSRRMGRDKPVLPFRGQSLLAGAVARFSTCFASVAISVARADSYPEIAAAHIVDRYPGCGPMAGLHAALCTLDGDVFLTAADMPFSDPEVALRMIALCGAADICVIRDGQGRYEPLFAFYRRSTLPHVAALLEAGQYTLLALFQRVRLCEISLEQLGLPPETPMLLNVNRPADYRRLLEVFDAEEQADMGRENGDEHTGSTDA